MSQSLEERIERLADALDSESKVRVRDARAVALAAPTRRRPRATLVAAAVASLLVLAFATWLLSTRGDGDDASVTTNSVADQPTTSVVTGEPDLQTVQLSPEQQVDWLTRHSESEASHHLPGWRTELGAERIVCDYAGVPGMSVESMGGSASDFPLGDTITVDRLIQACANGTDATRSAGIDLTSQGTLCRSVSTKRLFIGPADTAGATDVVVTESAVIFTGGSCEASGYQTPPSDFVDSIEQQRRTEILLRAVPRVCPTADETRAWVTRQVKTLPEQWTISISPVAGCVLPTVDWWSRTIFAP
jgi:hypothetical protein